MYVGVDEARHQVGAGDVLARLAFVAPKSDDMAVFDGDIHLEPFLGEHREHLAAGQHEVGRLVTPRDSHPMRVDEGQG